MKKLVFFMITLLVGLYASSYNANDAVRYAKKWSKRCVNYGCPKNWNTREFSKYDSFSGGRTDCANFVSQSIYYGGKDYDSVNNDDYDSGWYENSHEENIRHADFWFSKNICSMNGDVDYKNNSIAWVRASALRTRFAYRYTGGAKISRESKTRIGDIIFFRKKGGDIRKPVHTGIITKKIGVHAYFSAHTRDRSDQRLDVFKMYYDFEFYRPK